MKRTLHPLPLRVRPPFWAVEREPCSVPGCITIPNGYNPGPNCLAHTEDDTTEKRRSFILDRDARREARIRATV